MLRTGCWALTAVSPARWKTSLLSHCPLSTHRLASRQSCELPAQLALRTRGRLHAPSSALCGWSQKPFVPPAPYTLLSLFRCLHLATTGSRRRQWHPTPVLLPRKSHGRRSLVGCSPWGRSSRTQLSNFTVTFHFHAWEKEMATHSSVLAWRIPGTGKPGGLPSMGSHRVGHD